MPARRGASSPDGLTKLDGALQKGPPIARGNRRPTRYGRGRGSEFTVLDAPSGSFMRRETFIGRSRRARIGAEAEGDRDPKRLASDAPARAAQYLMDELRAEAFPRGPRCRGEPLIGKARTRFADRFRPDWSKDGLGSHSGIA